MEQILDSLDVAWVRAQEPNQEITAEVIYMSTYICFTLDKINNHSLTGDVYRLTLPSVQVITLSIKMFIDKLAYKGLKFMYNTNEIYTVDETANRERIRNEMFPVFEVEDTYYDNPQALDDSMFDAAEEFINNYACNDYDPIQLTEDIFEIGMYINLWEEINTTHFATGNRWVNIGLILLEIAKRTRNDSLSAIIIYNINQIISKLGATADMEFIRKAKEFSSNNTTNKLLQIWNNKLLVTIQRHNRIFYEI